MYSVFAFQVMSLNSLISMNQVPRPDIDGMFFVGLQQDYENAIVIDKSSHASNIFVTCTSNSKCSEI